MVCPVTPDDDFNVAIVVFMILAGFLFAAGGLAKRETRDAEKPSVQAEAEK